MIKSLKLKSRGVLYIMRGMFEAKRYSILGLAVIFLSGCSTIADIPKKIWGSSTQALETARAEAVTQVFQASWEECFDQVLLMTQKRKKEETDGAEEVGEAGKVGDLVATHRFTLFLKNRDKKLIVLMGVPRSVDTTEVGVFFTPLDQSRTRIEITSLSTPAKRRSSEIIFAKLKEAF